LSVYGAIYPFLTLSKNSNTQDKNAKQIEIRVILPYFMVDEPMREDAGVDGKT
jgi:flagellar basal body-associated protein FliL